MPQDYLNDIEKSAVAAFVSNKQMFDAVRKVLLHTIYNQGTIKPGVQPSETNWAFSLMENGLGGTKDNEQLGMEVRASVAALGYLKSGFDTLQELRTPELKKEKKNPAL